MIRRLSSITIIVLSLWGCIYLLTDWYEHYHGHSVPVIESRIEKKTNVLLKRLLDSTRFDVLVSVKTHSVQESTEHYLQEPDRITLTETSTRKNNQESSMMAPAVQRINTPLEKSSPGFSGVLRHTKEVQLEDRKERTEQESQNSTQDLERQFEELIINHKKNNKFISKQHIDRINILVLLDRRAQKKSTVSDEQIESSIQALLDLDYPVSVKVEHADFFDYSTLILPISIVVTGFASLWLLWVFLKWFFTRPKPAPKQESEDLSVEPEVLDAEKIKQDILQLVKSDISPVVDTMSVLLRDSVPEPEEEDDTDG